MSTRSRLNSEFDPALAADALRPFLVTLIESIVKGVGTSGATVSPAVGVHDLDTSHSGTLPWARVNKVGSALSDLASRAHAATTGLGEDDHSQYVHISNSRTVTGSHTWANTQIFNGAPGISSDDADRAFVMGRAVVGSVGHIDYAGFAHRDSAIVGGYALLQYAAGHTYLNAATGAFISHRINNSDVMVMNDARLNPAGSILKDLGDYNRKWRTLFAAELYVETLVAQSVLATIGGRIMVAPTVKLIADIDSSQTTIDTDYSSLLLNDYTYMATAPGGLAQIEAMKITGGPTPITGGYRYTVTRNLDGTGANSWLAGDAIVSLGNAVGKGYIELTSTSTIHNHLGPNITIYTRTGTANWNDVKPTTSMGNLRSFVDYSSDEAGFAVGNDLTLTPTGGFKGATIDRTNGLRMFNTSIREYQGGTLFLTLDTSGLEFSGVDQSYARVRWLTGGEVAEIGTHSYGDSYKRLDLRSWAATKSAVRIGAWNTGQTNSPVAYIEVRQDTYASAIHMVADAVGVGTTSPSYKLHVVGSTVALAVDGASRFGQGGMWGAIDAPSSGWIGFGTNFYYSGSQAKYRATNYASMMFCNDAIRFYTAGSGSAGADITWNEKVVIENAGNVGIGVSSPEVKLQVAGKLRVRSGTGGIIQLNDGDASNIGYIDWYTAAGVRQGYMGYGSSNVSLVLENSASFVVSGGDVQFNGAARFAGGYAGLADAAEPATSAAYAYLFVDSADGDLKVKFKNGAVKILATN